MTPIVHVGTLEYIPHINDYIVLPFINYRCYLPRDWSISIYGGSPGTCTADAHYPATPSSPSLGRYKVATLPKGMARGAIAISRQKTSRVYYLRHPTGVQNWISALIPYLHTSHTEHAVNLYMNPTVVSEYIAKECSAGRLLGPVPAPQPPLLQINRFGVIPPKIPTGKVVLDSGPIPPRR